MNESLKSSANKSESKTDSRQRILDEKLMELHSLFEVSQTINSSLNLNTILDNVLLTPMGKMLISKGMILLWDEQKKGFFIKRSKGFQQSELPANIIFSKIDLPNAKKTEELDEQDAQLQNFLANYQLKLVLPIRSSGQLIGILAFGKKLIGSDFTSSEIAYLQSVANIAAPTIQNGITAMKLQQVNRQLDKKILELNTLFEIGRELITTLERDKILNLLSYAIMGEMLVNRLLIFLHENGTYGLALGKGFKTNEDLSPIKKEHFLQEIFQIKKPVNLISDDTEVSIDARNILQQLKIHILVPIIMHDQVKGIIGLGERITKSSFELDELDFLTTLGNEALISIENARLFHEELKKKRMEEELALAREIQQKLLPTTFPGYERFEISGVNLSSLQVSGDYFDCIELDERHVCLAIADVSGKGTPASLLMANLQATLNALIEPRVDLVKITGKINKIIHKNTNYDKFITFFICLLDVVSGDLKYVNAGHNPPILMRSTTQAEMLSDGGLLLGMLPDAPFDCGETKLLPGDYLVMYTDGVTEAQDESGDEFGEDRLMELIQNNMHLSAEEMKETLLSSVKKFCGTVPQSDDITMVIVKAK